MTVSFGSLLRKRRLSAGLTQRELAEKAHLDFSYISKLENNRLPPPAADTVVLLCSILGVPADDLLAFTGKLPSIIEENISNSATAQRFFREAQGLTEEQWRQLVIRLSQIDTGLKRNSLSPTHANAYDLAQWADRYDAPGQLPLLVHRLARATAGDITYLQMSSEEGTRYKGYDGVLEVGSGNDFVPDHLSVWEMGVGSDPKQKADTDYNKRTAKPLGIRPSDAVFVFVTPRRWPGKKDWVAEKQKAGKWRDVRVLDADDLEAWLLLAPGVHAWISRLLGKDPGNVQDLESFWLDWREATQPFLSSKLLIAGRETVTQQLTQQLQAPANTLTIRADAQEEALAFIAAAFDCLSKAERDALFARTLIVYSADAWSQMTLTTQPLILIPMFAPIEAVQATRKGHHVLVPVGRETAETSGMVVLPRLARQQARDALLAMGVKEERVSSLATLAHRSLLSLRRQLAVNPALQQPPWAAREPGRSLLPALLAGSWDEALENDRNTIAALAGRPYEEVEADLVGYAQVSDPPVRRVGTIWFLTSKEDAWRLLKRFLTRQDLERFRLNTSVILATLDPALELPIEQRWQAGVIGYSRPHSRFLREGLADTLVLMITQPVSDLTGSNGSEANANAIVKQLFRQANDDQSGHTWLSLADIIPLLAEASPEAFQDALEIATMGPDPIIRHFFTDQSNNWFSARSPHTSLLWALERLAWSPSYMSEAALLLASLNRFYPESRLANRPGSSLRDIFVPWFPQTAATFDERLQALDRLRKQEPATAWALMIALLPRLHGETVASNDAPRWRDWKPEEQATSFTYAELWQATNALITKLLEDVHGDMNRICQIEERMENLPPPLREIVFQYLESLNPTAFDTNSRETLNAQLREQIANRHRFPHAAWAMPSEDIERLKDIYERFKPDNMLQQVAPLFTGSPHLLDEPDESDMKTHNDAAYQAQVAAARQVYKTEGLPGLLTLIEMVENVSVLGWVLGRSGVAEAEEVIFLQELDSSNNKHRSAAEAYVQGRFLTCEWEWADKQLDGNGPLQTPDRRANFFLNLPPLAKTWDRLERWGDDTISLYWTQVYPLVNDPVDYLRAAEQLLIYGQAWRALDLVAHYVESVQPSAEFVMNILEKALDTPLNSPSAQSLLYEVPQLLEYLEQMTKVDENRLARIEWRAMPLFRYEPHPLKTLYRQLSIDPQFFVELVSLAYRASDETPSEVNEQEQVRARSAYDVLHSANVVPGMQDAGQLDPTKLRIWVEEVRQILAERKRRIVGDLSIGQLLSHAKSGDDGVWPSEAIRELLEDLRSEDVERGMVLGIYKARGVTWRSLTDGGGQERLLMEQFRTQAQAIHARWPHAAKILRKLAQSYEEEAHMHDRESELRQNGW